MPTKTTATAPGTTDAASKPATRTAAAKPATATRSARTAARQPHAGRRPASGRGDAAHGLSRGDQGDVGRDASEHRPTKAGTSAKALTTALAAITSATKALESAVASLNDAAKGLSANGSSAPTSARQTRPRRACRQDGHLTDAGAPRRKSRTRRRSGREPKRSEGSRDSAPKAPASAPAEGSRAARQRRRRARPRRSQGGQQRQAQEGREVEGVTGPDYVLAGQAGAAGHRAEVRPGLGRVMGAGWEDGRRKTARPRVLDVSMAIDGEYVPSPSAWVRDQVEEYEGSGGTAGTTLLDTGLPVVVVTNLGAKTGEVRKTPLMRVEHEASMPPSAPRAARPRTRCGSTTCARTRGSRSRTARQVGHGRPRGRRRGAGRLVGAFGRGLPPLRRVPAEDRPPHPGLRPRELTGGAPANCGSGLASESRWRACSARSQRCGSRVGDVSARLGRVEVAEVGRDPRRSSARPRRGHGQGPAARPAAPPAGRVPPVAAERVGRLQVEQRDLDIGQHVAGHEDAQIRQEDRAVPGGVRVVRRRPRAARPSRLAAEERLDAANSSGHDREPRRTARGLSGQRAARRERPGVAYLGTSPNAALHRTWSQWAWVDQAATGRRPRGDSHSPSPTRSATVRAGSMSRQPPSRRRRSWWS